MINDNNNNNNTPVGCFKCKNKCDLCKYHLVENKVFHSACTGRFYSIRQDLNCKLKTGSANLNFLCNFSQLPQCLILACLLGGGGGRESLMVEACRAYLA